MRLELPRLRERFGGVLFYGLQSVYEMDSGLRSEDVIAKKQETTLRISYEELYEQFRSMAIVIPIREERLRLLDGVLAGIPHPCQIILVSNSARSPIDRFQLEEDVVSTFSAYTDRPIITVHQRDSRIAQALVAAGYPHLLDESGLVRSGKAEGMMLGVLMAKLSGNKYVGFIDADNYFPGAVLEYCYLYASGFASAKHKPYTMVRIAWNSKPKVVETGLYFVKWGRSSIVTNHYLNQLVSHYTGFETEAIRTGNAGEHAMTLDLAMEMAYSSGYSIEPYQLVYLMEEFGGSMTPHHTHDLNSMVGIYQMESRNPHLHERKGDEHVDQMIEASLSVIYHSTLCPDTLKKAIEVELQGRGIRQPESKIPKMDTYPPLSKLDFGVFRESLAEGYNQFYPKPADALVINGSSKRLR